MAESSLSIRVSCEVGLRLTLLLLTVVLSHASLHSSFTLTYSPDRVTRGVTQNVTLRCAHDGRTRSLLSEVARMRMLRKTGKGWRLVAEKKVWSEPEVFEQNATVSALTSDGIQSMYVEVTWPVAVDTTLGVYKCDVLGFDKDARSAVDSPPLVELTDVYVSDLIELLADTKQELSQEIHNARDRQDKALNTMQHDVSMLKQNFSFLENDMSRIFSEFDSLKEEMMILEDHIFAFWPGGMYALLQSKNGCPRGSSFVNKDESYFKFHTESSSGSTNKDSVPSFLPANSSFNENGNNFVLLKFCEKNEGLPSNGFWPGGSYCINKISQGACPTGFQSGAVELDGEDYKPAQSHAGSVVYPSSGHESLIGFCCRSSPDQPASSPIPLPSRSPFILYRHGGTCQAVLHMNVLEASLVVDTEDNNNGDRLFGVLPDIDVNTHGATVFHVCHYST